MRNFLMKALPEFLGTVIAFYIIILTYFNINPLDLF